MQADVWSDLHGSFAQLVFKSRFRDKRSQVD